MSLSDFKSHSEALKTADDLVAQNKKDLGHDHEPVVHANPLLTKVFYIHAEGKKRSMRQEENKSLMADGEAKTKKQLTDAHAFIEGMGDGLQGSDSSSSGVKIENLVFVAMSQQKDSLKPST